MDDCIFCKIIKGEIPSYKIYENNKVYAFLSIQSEYYGHTLVIPKNHSQNLLDIKSEDISAVMDAVTLISNHYVNKCGFTGVNVLNASGADAEQSVFHTHIHIIPRKADDGINAWPARDKRDYNFTDMCNHLKINK